MIKKISFLILLNLLTIIIVAQENGKQSLEKLLLSPLALTPYRSIVNINSIDSLYKLHTKKIIFFDKRNLNVPPGLRYLTESLEGFSSEELDYIESIEILSKYVRNDSVRFMANYLKKYIKSTSRRENAIRKLKEKLKRDSFICIINNNLPSNILRDSIRRRCKEMDQIKELLEFVERDSSYKWILDKSRDSVLLRFNNSSNDSLNIWVNNKREKTYRFWLKNIQNDSIGSWIQTKSDNSLKIIADYDVYQHSKADKQYIIKQPPIVIIDTTLNKMGKMYPYKRIYTKWRYASIVNLGLTQGKVANWQEGGENSIAGLFDVEAFTNYKYKTISWDNLLNYRYGIMQSGDEQVKKTEDLLEFNSKLGVKFYRNWYFSTMLNFKTQIFKGYSYKVIDKPEIISSFLSPAYVIISLGIDYKPNSSLSVLLAPFTGKYTIVKDTANVNPVNYGIKKGETIKREIGSYVKTVHKWQISKEIKLNNELGLFRSYEGESKETDVDWKTTLNMKVNYFISTKIFTHVLYDKTVSKKLQFKEILNIGITYHF